MIQEILALTSFTLAIVYTLYSIAKLFIPGMKGSASSLCSGCGGSCGLKSELKAVNEFDKKSSSRLLRFFH
ncbi:MAG: hypothetical protein J7L04_00860 [Bacteroidales bacterium]|nr:hypothetical protein [Bacteroidales bacterium]